MNIPQDCLNMYTTQRQAEQINKIILSYVDSTSAITDATACVGGNSILFARDFSRVISVEKNHEIFKILKSNLKPYFKTCTCYNSSYNDIKFIIKQDVVFIDPLYKITAGADIGKANQLFPITEGLEEIKIKYNSTVAVIHHLLKGNHELGLQDDRMAGSSELGFWMEHCVLITKTNEPFLRMLTWGDSRSIATPDQYYGLDFDPKNYSLTNRGTIDWEKYLLTKKKKKEYEYYLSFMDDEFTTDDWHKKTWDDEVPVSTSEKWLYHCRDCKMIEDEGYGNWKKKLKVI